MPSHNRSAPPHGVIPVLVYDDVADAVDWLIRVFAFAEKVQVGDHRSQLLAGTGAVIVADASHGRRVPAPDDGVTHSTMVRVDDVDAHHRHAAAEDAEILSDPADQPFGERQYTARDLGGHLWTFTQSVRDVDPEEWGGRSISPW
jgi:uncharacterized glyoxalase superfamily protein PhnB